MPDRANHTRFLGTAFLSLIAVAGIAAAQEPPATQPAQSRQSAQHFEKQATLTLNYLLFLPDGYAKDSDKKWPLIIFLHGGGERGTDLNQVKRHGPPKIVEEQKDFPFVVVSPQCPADSWWHTEDLNALLDEVLADYHVDPDRVYLTGLSMGGFETWEWAEQYPDRFAAIAPMSAEGSTVLVGSIKNLPIWVFHGDADRSVPVACSDRMVAALKAVGADVRYTRYPGVGHECWAPAYAGPDLYTWFLSHHRGEVRTPTTQPATPGK